MKRNTRLISTAASNPWFVIIGGLCSIIGFIAYLFDKLDPKYEIWTKAGFLLALSFLTVGYFYSAVVRRENIALKSIARLFYEINEIYRSKLQISFFGENPITKSSDLLDAEKIVLRSVCQRIENIFSTTIGRNCMVTIKLVTKPSGQSIAQTYVRSQESCLRDKPSPVPYKIGTGENTAFDQSIMSNANGQPPHFFSADLSSHNGYSNQRQHFETYYSSTLVVPIRGESAPTTGHPIEYDLLGFLCVDTLSKNRLNDKNHLYMLAALSQQMYNFMSLMRGKYTVFVE
jgi:hypothetical protein